MQPLNRRRFSQGLMLSTGSLLLARSPSALAQPREGSDYVRLDQRAPVDSPAGKVEVLEFFWYNCPHCNQFEPAFDAWMKRQPAHVSIKRVPVAFRDSFVPQQQLYYALETMGKVDELHKKVFYTIHVEKQHLDTPAQILDWVVKQGLDRTQFENTFKSFGVVGKARRAAQLQNAYQVDGVPSLGIAGRYFTSGTHAGTLERSLQVADFLIEQARKN